MAAEPKRNREERSLAERTTEAPAPLRKATPAAGPAPAAAPAPLAAQDAKVQAAPPAAVPAAPPPPAAAATPPPPSVAAAPAPPAPAAVAPAPASEFAAAAPRATAPAVAPAAAPPPAPPQVAAAPAARRAESAASVQDQAALPTQARAGLRAASPPQPMLAGGPNVSARWTQLRLEADGRAVVVTREQAGVLADLIARALQAPPQAPAGGGPAQLRLELGRGADTLGTLSLTAGGWRWVPSDPPGAGYLLRVPPTLAGELRDEAERLMPR